MRVLFGTDGVRGIANIELTGELAYKLGQAGAYILTAETKHVPRILVGTDTRISCDMLEAAIVAGICSVGAEAIVLGVIPTPAVAELTREYKADAGIMISASHNPFEFNGIKFFDKLGYKLSDSIERKIEECVLNNNKNITLPIGEAIGKRTYKESALEDYVNFLKRTVRGSTFDGIKVVLDCANGAAHEAAPFVFRELGAEVYVINNQPNGININDNCGSTHIEQLKEAVISTKSDLGLAFDGDADRVLAVDEKGNFIDGDQIMAIIGVHLKKNGRLAKNTIVSTVMSNIGLEIMALREGINLVSTSVGDRYVLEKMISEGYTLGGEQSGHLILLEENTTGDGLLTALQLVNIIKTDEKNLSEAAAVMEVFPQILKNVKVDNANKSRFLHDEEIKKMYQDVSEKLGEQQGRVLIRPSGTEPLVRIMIEGRNYEDILDKANRLAELIERRLS